MIQNYTKEQLSEAFLKLPEEIQNVLSSLDTTNAIRNMGEKYNLHVDQIGALNDEAGLVMFGLTKMSDFTSHIQQRLPVSPDIASQIATDVNTEIFAKIRASLQSLGSPGVPAARATAFPTSQQDRGETTAPASTVPVATPVAPASTAASTPSVLEEKLTTLYSTPATKPKVVDPYLEPVE